jgi:hypothetical protein
MCLVCILIGCQNKPEPEPQLVDTGKVIKLIVRQETAVSVRSEKVIVETATSRYKIYTEYFVVGDSVNVYKKGNKYYLTLIKCPSS